MNLKQKMLQSVLCFFGFSILLSIGCGKQEPGKHPSQINDLKKSAQVETRPGVTQPKTGPIEIPKSPVVVVQESELQKIVKGWQQLGGATTAWIARDMSGHLDKWSTSAEDETSVPVFTLKRFDKEIQQGLPMPPANGFGLTLPKTSDEELKGLAGYDKLLSLDLELSEISDAGLRQLADMDRLKQLELLYLGRTKVTDTGALELGACKQLRSLSLIDTRIGDPGVKGLNNLQELRDLELAYTQVSDSSMEIVGKLRNLRSLDLAGTRITDSGLGHLAGLPNLRSLRLAQTAITDGGLKHIARFPRLETLSLIQAKVTENGVDELKKGMPRLKIIWR